jgi:antagonist of KipI
MLTTVQDLGRIGHQQEGVPVGGAMDQWALRVGNLLVGNDDGDAALEITLAGPSIVFDGDALIALTGGDLAATLNDRTLPTWHPVRVPSGAVLEFHAARSGCRVYLTAAGGIDVPRVLGSRSTYVRAGLGGHQGRALRRDDVLSFGAPSALAARIAADLHNDGEAITVARWGAGPSLRPAYSPSVTVRLLPGAHVHQLTAASRDQLFSAPFRVASQSDRMGYRLEGPTLELREPLELLSEGVTFGTVQLPPSGSPIVLLADRQTTGGYPRVGEVASADLPLLAQLKPGDQVRFRKASVEEAQAVYLAREQELAEARRAIRLLHPQRVPWTEST